MNDLPVELIIIGAIALGVAAVLAFVVVRRKHHMQRATSDATKPTADENIPAVASPTPSGTADVPTASSSDTPPSPLVSPTGPDPSGTPSLTSPSTIRIRVDGPQDTMQVPDPLSGVATAVGLSHKHYTLGTPLGAGRMTVAYEAFDWDNKRDVVIKFLPAQLTSDNKALHAWGKRFMQPVLAMEHPNLIPMYEVGMWDGRPFVCMERLDGITLEQKLAALDRASVSFDELVAIAETLMTVLEFAHARGIHHGDLRPANIMLTPQNEVIVMDMGLAMAFDPELWASGTGIHYLAPEQLEFDASDRRADLFGMGVTLYVMWTGCFPFVDIDRDTLPVASSRYRPDTPRGLELLLGRCLSSSPFERPTSFDDMRVALHTTDELPSSWNQFWAEEGMPAQGLFGEPVVVWPPEGTPGAPPPPKAEDDHEAMEAPEAFEERHPQDVEAEKVVATPQAPSFREVDARTVGREAFGFREANSEVIGFGEVQAEAFGWVNAEEDLADTLIDFEISVHDDQPPVQDPDMTQPIEMPNDLMHALEDYLSSRPSLEVRLPKPPARAKRGNGRLMYKSRPGVYYKGPESGLKSDRLDRDVSRMLRRYLDD